MGKSPSLASRTLLAAGLMLGFYLLALAIVAGLLFLPYAEWTYAHRLHFKLAFGCVAGSGLILWSILPRWDRFEAPGPRLEAVEQPRLFDVLRGVAGATSQEMPSEVYLVRDVNAWVAQRGGIMGLGSRRVMGIGLPLMQVLTVPELRAVLAHEFGHYHGGDTKLGPWIYKTRSAIGRTVQSLAAADSVLQKPFIWYGNLFLRITHAISRRQELIADRLAATTVGANSLCSGLRKVRCAALAEDTYWSKEILPLLKCGFRPPLASGFASFLSSPGVASAVESAVQQLNEKEGNVYDTHPPLRERLAAVADLAQPELAPEGTLSVSLLQAVPELESKLLTTLAGEAVVQKLAPVEWDHVGTAVYQPRWASTAASFAKHLEGLTPVTLPTSHDALKELGQQVLGENAANVEPEQLLQVALQCLAIGVAAALGRNGWTASALPGDDVVFRRNGHDIKPFAAVQALLAGTLTAEAWRQECEAAGIAGADLGRAEKLTV